MSLRQTLAASAVFALVLYSAGCTRPNPWTEPGATAAATDNTAVASAPLPPIAPAAGPSDHATPAAAKLAPDQPLQVLPDEAVTFAPRPAADAVLQDWAAAIERRDWPTVRALWGNRGEDSGLSTTAFAARWDNLRHPRVTVGAGVQEGAAGSIYYTAPVTIVDGRRRMAGVVTLRRVNDVPGATVEQLRWRLDATTRAPWTAR